MGSGRLLGVFRSCLSILLYQQFEDFTRIGKAAGFLFRVDQLAVDLDVEDSAAALDQSGLFSESFLKFGHQTGGFGIVISLAAVFYSDRHKHFLFSISFSVFRFEAL